MRVLHFTASLGLSLSLLFAGLAGGKGTAAESTPQWDKETPPLIATLLKPLIYKRVVQDRDALAYAKLEGDPPTQVYSFYAAMQVRAGTDLTRRILTDYQLYAKMIPYVDRAVYSTEKKTLHIEGGIWRFKINSTLQFEERGSRWVHFKIVAGHFKGMDGDVYFESMGESGTLVYMKGFQVGSTWPPRFVIERGAEIVFGFTARRMRSYIESQKLTLESHPSLENRNSSPGSDHGKEIPKPRSHL